MAKHRKSHRRRHTKRARRTHRRMRGGGSPALSPAPYGSNALGGLDLNQGKQFALMHQGQHGGANKNKNATPTGGWAVPIQMGGAASLESLDKPMLPPELLGSARVAETFAQYDQIRGLTDQAGGRRRRRGCKSRKMRRSRKMRGGALVLTPAEVGWKEAVSVPQGVNPQFATWDASA